MMRHEANAFHRRIQRDLTQEEAREVIRAMHCLLEELPPRTIPLGDRKDGAP